MKNAVAALIIGHTTHDSATVWVRGDERLTRVRITLAREGEDHPTIPPDVRELCLRRASDYTDVATFQHLSPATRYGVVAHFSSSVPGLGEGVLGLGAEVVRRVHFFSSVPGLGGGAVQCHRGGLRTFPEPDTRARFCFLLGSCNLSTARLTSLRELGAGFLGTSAVRRSLERPIDTWYWPTPHCIRRPLSWAGRWLARGLLGGVARATRFQLPEPDFPSPFRALRAQLLGPPAAVPAFMIHAGDQIYFDLDIPQREPTVEEYRRAYRQAWFEDEDVREFLAYLPHYMILDDHEIVDSFDNAAKDASRRDAAVAAYREYVHQRQPGGDVVLCERPHAARGSSPGKHPPTGGPLYYQFEYGEAIFFVLDTRTERCRNNGEMIGRDQMAIFLGWLAKHPTRLKFVVSSVPFVAQVRPPEPGKEREEDSATCKTCRKEVSKAAPRCPHCGEKAPGLRDERRDKWCGEDFTKQRDRIIEEIYKERIERLVFLVGDMHCAYHAIMRVGPPDERVVIHELAGGPINQVGFATRGQFCDHYRGVLRGTAVPYTSLLRSFHAGAASVTRVTVDPGASPMLRWEIVRTDTRTGSGRLDEPGPLCGRISF